MVKKETKNSKKLLLFSLLILLSVVSIQLISHNLTKRPKTSIESSPDKTDQIPQKNDKSDLANQNANNSHDNGYANKVLSVSSDTQKPVFKTQDGQTFPLITYKTLANDPYANQWWTASTGLNTAWLTGAGPRQTIIAVIDTGFALNHEEFTNRWAINDGEMGITTLENPSKLNCTDRGLPLNRSCNLIDDNFDGIVDNESGSTSVQAPSQLNCTDRSLPLNKSCNLIDDDGNGYYDDVTGWDFANFGPNPIAGKTNLDGDSTSHGTEVAGVMAATGNNNLGIAGVNWTTKILPLQAVNDDGYGNTLTVANAIYYAANRGADIISLSLGADESDTYTRAAIAYAIDRGTLVVAASGNDGCNCISYPANYPEVLAVGSHTSSNTPSTFSNYGNNLDILAPGEGIRSSSWIKTNQSSAYINNIAGTSFAAPYVSGLLGLARSHQPDASWGELVNNLLAQANHTGLTYNNPFSINVGSGYVRADNYMDRVTTPTSSAIRYNFGPTRITSTLASYRTYQCFSPQDFPAMQYYRISSGSSIFYTIDNLEAYRATNRGNTVTNLGRACVGLPNDNDSTLRSINLLSEIENISLYKQ